MITYLQAKTERALITSTLVTLWGILIAVQGVALVMYPLYQAVTHHRKSHATTRLANAVSEAS